MILSILIPTLPQRKEIFDSLLENLNKQRLNKYYDVEIIIDSDDNNSIGTKRNHLLELAEGEYVCFIDDDDDVSENYIDLILQAIKNKPDCVSLKGIMTTDGHTPEIFEHSIKYSEFKTTTNEVIYERYPNHLNTIKSEIAKQFKFLEINHGEDYDWATQINRSGLLKNESYISDVIYYYKFIPLK